MAVKLKKPLRFRRGLIYGRSHYPKQVREARNEKEGFALYDLRNSKSRIRWSSGVEITSFLAFHPAFRPLQERSLLVGQPPHILL